jgi:glycosyltransferase involved in cell wall biosynthesis
MLEPYVVVQIRFTGGIGGAESVAFSLTKVLNDYVEGSILYLVLENRCDAQILDGVVSRVQALGIRYRIFRTDSKWSATLLRQLGRALSEDRADVAHAHCYKSAFYALALRHLGRRPRRVVFTLHGLFDPLNLKSALIHVVNALDVALVDRIVACSGELCAKYEGYPGLKRKLEVIQNGLFIDERHDLARIAAERDEVRTRMTAQWRLDASAVWVACIGRLTEQKNLPLYLKVARQIVMDSGFQRKVQFLVVGDGELRQPLEALVSEMGLTGHVFFTSFVSDTGMVLTGIDLLMLTSVWEGTPMCVLEAMAYGKAVVSTAVGGIPDIVSQNETGILTEGFEPAELARVTMDLLSDDERRERMGRTAHHRATTQLSHRNWADRHCAMYRRVLGATNATSVESVGEQ